MSEIFVEIGNLNIFLKGGEKMKYKNNKALLITAILLFVCIASILTAFAHSGRTDSSGGHRDNNNVSGLGSYHYHCGGHPPHLHTNGRCPYKSYSSSNSTSSSNKTVNKSSQQSLSQQIYDEGYYEGYRKGYSSGQAIGYNDGYSKGYNEGYEVGYNDSEEKYLNILGVVSALSFVGILIVFIIKK